jgi:nucleotide-binding universal stress UspA family protein
VDGLAGRVRAAGVDASSEVISSPAVAESIVMVADESGADLIVMSSEALTGAARALFGSVTDAVVRTAGCPVLVVRRPRPSESATSDGLDQSAEVAVQGAE